MEIISYKYAIPYLIFLGYLLVLMFIEFGNINKQQDPKFVRKFLLVGFLIFIGLRGFVYGDVINYKRWFERSPTLFSDDFQKYVGSLSLNFGFTFLMILVKTIWNNYLFFQFVLAVIQLILLDIVIRRYSKYYVMPFLFFYIFGGLFFYVNLIRQFTVVCCFLCSIKYIEKPNLIKYLIVNLIGAAIHFSALIYIPLYFILNKKIPLILFWCLFIIGNILFLAKIDFIKVIFDKIVYLLPGKLAFVVKAYAVKDKLAFFAPDFNLSLGYFERAVSFIVLMLFYPVFYQQGFSRILYNTMLLFLFCFYYFAGFNDLMNRLMLLFIFFYWFLFPQLYKRINYEKKCLFLVIFIFLGISKTIQSNNSIMARYDNILFGVESIEERIQSYK